MPTHDIIDNRNERLVDHILSILPATARAKFAVGYFFLSGLEALGRSLDTVEELRLLIGNTSNRETIEQLAEGYKRLELAAQAALRHAVPGAHGSHGDGPKWHAMPQITVPHAHAFSCCARHRMLGTAC